MKFVRFLAIPVILLASNLILAQESTSSASVSRSRSIANNSKYQSRTVFTPPDKIAVEEFVNYHRHRIPLPKGDQAVNVDLRWGNGNFSEDTREAVLQVGLATAWAHDRSELRPLNLSIVIDKSGSMSGQKIERVKQSLRTMIKQLRPNDVVSIITFSDEALILCEAQPVGNGRTLEAAINRINTSGSTNLDAGLMLGYREVTRNLDSRSTNRVILLTDGRANQGIVDPREIASRSTEFNNRGIDLSTIGIGSNLDQDLLRTLSEKGRGLFHFVSDYADIDKVFVKEVQSLMSAVARNVTLDIDFGRGLRATRVYGYKPNMSSRRISVPLENMNAGLTQLVLVKFRVSANRSRDTNVTARLRFEDYKTGSQRVETSSTSLRYRNRASADMLRDSVVKKNYTIAEMALALADVRKNALGKRYRRAASVLRSTLIKKRDRFPGSDDKDLRFVSDILETYRSNLDRFLSERSASLDRESCEVC